MDSRSGTALCQICQREFAEEDDLVPRILTECGHTLCTHCAKKILGSQKAMLCPFDRISTSVPDGDVRKLKKNFTILQIKEEEKYRRDLLIKSARKDKKMRKSDGTCDENPSHRATNFCKSCDADLCDECWDWVHSLAILAHHEKTLMFNKPINAPDCSVHNGVKAEFVCKDKHCAKLQRRLMCHVCFREKNSHHFDHGYVPLQTEVVDIRTKMLQSLSTSEQKEVAILANIEKLEEVIKTYVTDGISFNDKMSEVTRFWHVNSKENDIRKQMERVIEGRVRRLEQRIANQKADLDWIRKNKASIERLILMESIRLVDVRFEVDMTIGRIETAIVKHPKSLLPCGMCNIHVSSLNPLNFEIRPMNRIELRDNSNQILDYIKKRNPNFGCAKSQYRHKSHLFRIMESADSSIEDIKLYSEGLSLVVVADPFDGDHDTQCGTLEFLENAPAYENIIVGLTPFNFQAVSTFLVKLVDIGERDPRIQIVYMNDEDKDIERMLDSAMERKVVSSPVILP
uniref:RING-type domain-containing protein n=1 Tax=Caenorhabditis tropicalis TaxID=1561998 RepID=A0A1I7TS60_9PELO